MIGFGAMVEYNASFDPHYKDEEEELEEDPFDEADECFDEEYEEEESE